jgi:molecular chaperone GrpE
MTRIPINDETPEPGATNEGQYAEAGGTGTPAAGTVDALAGLTAERDDLYNRLARATADFKNSQKRMQTEFDQRSQYANQSLMKSLLPVIDNFERALAVDTAKVDAKSILKGLQLVHDQWLAVLKQNNVEEIAPAPGDPFDPSRHEALMQQDAPQYAGKGATVVASLQKGYALHGRTLRPAQVAVSKT